MRQDSSTLLSPDSNGGPITWQPYEEPLGATVARTVTIAVVIGAVLTRWMGGLAHWPAATLLALWPSLGGHWIELWFLNWLRPRLPSSRAARAGVRLGVWFVGGIALGIGMRLTATVIAGSWPARWSAWWVVGLGFIGLELVVHLVLELRRRPNFYDGRG